MMDEKSFCENVALELSKWKSRIDNIALKFDRTSSGDKAHVVAYVNELHMFMEELSDRIRMLDSQCAAAFPEAIEKIPESHYQKEWKGVWEDVSPAEIGG
ncbi:MAG TPA: hypothetical protein VK463_00160 [Desulfomonilaceae bacterium]|nr:hypothetical protein [Desulfomonilaceae bacterium]